MYSSYTTVSSISFSFPRLLSSGLRQVLLHISRPPSYSFHTLPTFPFHCIIIRSRSIHSITSLHAESRQTTRAIAKCQRTSPPTLQPISRTSTGFRVNTTSSKTVSRSGQPICKNTRVHSGQDPSCDYETQKYTRVRESSN